MQNVKGYCLSLIIISVCVGICILFAPDGRSSGKQLRFIGALCITFFLISPLRGLISAEIEAFDLPEIKVSEIEDSASREIISDAAEKIIAQDAQAYITENFDVNCIMCTAHLKNCGEGIVQLDYILLEVDISSDFLTDEIKSALSEKYSCSVYISKRKE